MKDAQRALLAAIGQRISLFGFESKAVGQSFLRYFPGGRASFHLAYIQHDNDFDVVADVAVRFDELENLVNQKSHLLSAREKKQTYSLGAELGNISGAGQTRWTVTSLADVPSVADELVDAFRKIGLPYIEKAMTVDAAFQMLKSPGPEAWLHSPIHASRLKRVIGLAMILGKNDEIPELVRQCLRTLEELKDPGLMSFKRFLADLDLA